MRARRGLKTPQIVGVWGLSGLREVENAAIELSWSAGVALDGFLPENFGGETAVTWRGLPVTREEVKAEVGGFLPDVLFAVFWQNHEFSDAVACGEMLGVSVDHGEAEELITVLLADKEGEVIRLSEVTVKPFVFKDGVVGHLVTVGGTFFKKGVLQQAVKGVFLVDSNFV